MEQVPGWRAGIVCDMCLTLGATLAVAVTTVPKRALRRRRGFGRPGSWTAKKGLHGLALHEERADRQQAGLSRQSRGD
jgi:hypothetical protein